MTSLDIIAKLKAAGLRGRGGAGYLAADKWQLVHDTPADQKYIVCNVSEGELAVKKDYFLLKHYPQTIVDGIKIALEYLSNAKAFIYLNKRYYAEFEKELSKLIKGQAISLFREKGGYLSGEESVVCEEIEDYKNFARPRVRPPYPATAGIDRRPTLINNAETFYFVAKIAADDYHQTRFYTISGHCAKPGVYELPLSASIRQILEQTGNLPVKSFFVQTGGGASGEIFLDTELDNTVSGSGAVVVYDRVKTDPYAIMKVWTDFFLKENCDKCTPCREGVYRLAQMVESKKLDPTVLEDLFFVMEKTSFCGLGKSVPTPFRSLINKVVNAK